MVDFWNRRPWFFLAVQVALTACAAWWWWHLPLPGYSVALMGGAAAVMSLQGEMHRGRKAWWMFLIGVLLFVEFRAIKEDKLSYDAQRDMATKQEQMAFQKIADQMDSDIQLSRNILQGTAQVSGGVKVLEKAIPPSLKSVALKMASDIVHFVEQRGAEASSARDPTAYNRETFQLFRSRYQDELVSIVQQLRVQRVFDYPYCDTPMVTTSAMEECAGALQLAAKRLP